MKQIILILLSFLLIATAQASRKALLIGNADYQSRPLTNPINDVTDIKKKLIKLGFTVRKETNLNRKQMRSAIRNFRQTLKQGDEALVYYSGHGASAKGENYLIPVNNDITDEFEISDGAVSLNFLLENLASSPSKLNIVILDACRDNPFKSRFRSSSRGLARLKQQYSGTLVAFAASEGGVSDDGRERNGLYTKYLLKHLVTSGISLNEMFTRVRKEVVTETEGKQFPVEENGLLETIYLAGRKIPEQVVVIPDVSTEKRPHKLEKQKKIRPHRVKNGQYIDHDNGTVTDTKTGLVWKKCSEGQRGNNCGGKAKSYTWNDAVKRFRRVRFAGYIDWRLPTKKELRTLVYCSNRIPQSEAWDYWCSGKNDRGRDYQQPTIRQPVFSNTVDSWYWSSSPYADYSGSAWGVNFDNGDGGANFKSSNGYVRLVRSEQ